jgi:hypothetical protein
MWVMVSLRGEDKGEGEDNYVVNCRLSIADWKNKNNQQPATNKQQMKRARIEQESESEIRARARERDYL